MVVQKVSLLYVSIHTKKCWVSNQLEMMKLKSVFYRVSSTVHLKKVLCRVPLAFVQEEASKCLCGKHVAN